MMTYSEIDRANMNNSHPSHTYMYVHENITIFNKHEFIHLNADAVWFVEQ